MAWHFASEFSEITEVMAKSDELRKAMIALVNTAPHHGKALEGGTRQRVFKSMLTDLILGKLPLSDSYTTVEALIPAAESIHADDRRTFSKGWGKRLVRIQLSRFYNRAIMEELLSQNETQCFVPHSKEESSDTCIKGLAGKDHDLKVLHERLVDAHDNGNHKKYENLIKVPNHPHCSHVVAPPRKK